MLYYKISEHTALDVTERKSSFGIIPIFTFLYYPKLELLASFMWAFWVIIHFFKSQNISSMWKNIKNNYWTAV